MKEEILGITTGKRESYGVGSCPPSAYPDRHYPPSWNPNPQHLPLHPYGATLKWSLQKIRLNNRGVGLNHLRIEPNLCLNRPPICLIQPQYQPITLLSPLDTGEEDVGWSDGDEPTLLRQIALVNVGRDDLEGVVELCSDPGGVGGVPIGSVRLCTLYPLSPAH